MSTTLGLIDIASFSTIVDYLKHDEDIDVIIDVKDEKINEVADIFVEGTDVSRAEEKAIYLVESNRIQVHRYPATCLIPLDQTVEVIRLPPIYFVKEKK